MQYQYHDGGRKNAGYKGQAGDCVIRAVAILEGSYYEMIYSIFKDWFGYTPRNGVKKRDTRAFFKMLGYTWHPTMIFGRGCKVHLRADELPSGKIACQVSKHVVAVVNGVIHDTHNPARGGTRCVYGYWIK